MPVRASAATFTRCMDEYRSSQAVPGSWPVPQQPDQFQADAEPLAGAAGLASGEEFDHRTAVADVIAFTGDTRRLTLISAGLLAAVLVGTAVVGAGLLVRGRPLGLGSLGLLAPVLVSWLLTAALVLFAEGPVTSGFAELRRATGAMVDPTAPWTPARAMADSEVTWDYVLPLIAAARRQHARARLALSVAVLTTAGFLLWMFLSLAVAALI
jgi:hypothetical protein